MISRIVPGNPLKIYLICTLITFKKLINNSLKDLKKYNLAKNNILKKYSLILKNKRNFFRIKEYLFCNLNIPSRILIIKKAINIINNGKI